MTSRLSVERPAGLHDGAKHTDYPVVVWVGGDPDCSAWLCVEVEIRDGWVLMWADAWLYPASDSSGNDMAYSETPVRMAVPAHTVRSIGWKD